MVFKIGFVGRKRSGKDTCASYLVDNYEFKNYSFASPLKEACKHIYCLQDEDMELGKDKLIEHWNMTPRDMLKLVGTEFFRNKDKDHWIKNMNIRISKENNVSVSDVRFQNEASFLKEKGFILVHILRNNMEEDNHESEVSSDSIKCDYNIQNNGTIEELYSCIDSILLSIS